MEEPTFFEQLSGNLPTRASLAVLAAAVGAPIAALLPVLADSLAAGRHRQRVESELQRIANVLAAHRHRLDCLSDPQYKLLNEVVLAVLQNTENEKVTYLRSAIRNGLDAHQLTHARATQISRILRDISAEELRFVCNSSAYQFLMIGPIVGHVEARTYVVDPDGVEMSLVTGLISLGVLVPRGSSMAGIGQYTFAVFVQELVGLVTVEST